MRRQGFNAVGGLRAGVLLAAVTFPLFVGTHIGGNLSVADGWLLALLGVCVVVTFFRDDGDAATKVLLLAALLGFVVGSSALFAVAPGAAIRDGIQQMLYIVGAWLLLTSVRKGFSLDAIESGFIGATTLAAVIALSQYVVFRSAGINILAPLGHMIGGSDWIQGYYRAAGTFRHFNQLAVAMLPGFAFALFRGRTAHLALILCAILASGSRSGVGAAVLIVITYLIAQRGSRSMVIGGALIVAVAALVLANPDLVAKRLSFLASGEVDASTLIRLRLLQVGFQLFVEHPFLGVGIGQFKPLTGFDSLESSVFLIAVETGLIGMALFHIVLMAGVIRSWQRREAAYAAAIVAVYLNVLVHPFLTMSIMGPLCWMVLLSPFVLLKNLPPNAVCSGEVRES